MFYPDEIKNLLKEAVKNSVAYGENSQITNKIFLWLLNIEIINQQEDNLDFQAFYLELLGLMCIDRNGKGIIKYQNII